MTARRWHVTPDAPGGISWETGPDDPGGSDVQELFVWNDPRDADTVDAVKALAQCVATLTEARQLAHQIKQPGTICGNDAEVWRLLFLLTGDGAER